MKFLYAYVLLRELAIVWAIVNLLADVFWGLVGAERRIRRQIAWLRGWLHG